MLRRHWCVLRQNMLNGSKGVYLMTFRLELSLYCWYLRRGFFLPLRQKDRFGELLVRNSIPVAGSAMQTAALRLRTKAHSEWLNRRRQFGPHALGLIALAITVALWGYGYKLSLYHRHVAPSQRVLVAKLWIEPRDASVAAGFGFEAKSHLVPGAQALSVAFQKPANYISALICIPSSTTRGLAYFDFLIPSRSPPPHSFSRA